MSNQDDDASQVVDQEQLVELPGTLLKNARVGMEISVKEVAQRLNLKEDVIVHLEKDEYEELPETAYVRGYLRSYAALLGLGVDDAISKTTSLVLKDLKPVPTPTPLDKLYSSRPTYYISTSKKKTGRRFLKFLGVFLTIILGGYVFFQLVSTKIDQASIFRYFKLPGLDTSDLDTQTITIPELEVEDLAGNQQPDS